MAGRSPLKKISIFSGLGKAELALLESRASRQRFPPETIVINEGDDSDSMFVILSGKVRVFVTDENGNEVNIDKMGKSDYFGEYALLDGSKRSASVITTTQSDFLVISKDTIIEMFTEDPDTAFSLIGDLVSRIRELTSTIKNLSLMEIQGRVAGALLNLAKQDGEHTNITEEELASQVDAPADIVDGIMRDLETAGYITREGNNIVLNESRS